MAITFAASISAIAPKISRDDYTVLLHELRGLVRDRGLHRVAPGEVNRDVLRDITSAARLPPRVRDLSKAAGVAAGVIGGLGVLIPSLSVSMAAAGALVGISTALWQGTLPRAAARVWWLRWALSWDVENQVERRSR